MNVWYHDQHVDKCLKILMLEYHVWYAHNDDWFIYIMHEK